MLRHVSTFLEASIVTMEDQANNTDNVLTTMVDTQTFLNIRNALYRYNGITLNSGYLLYADCTANIQEGKTRFLCLNRFKEGWYELATYQDIDQNIFINEECQTNLVTPNVFIADAIAKLDALLEVDKDSSLLDKVDPGVVIDDEDVRF